MSLEKHDLHHEFPEFNEEIRQLKMTDNHFAKLFKEYHELDHEVHRIEQGVETPADDYVEQVKINRLKLKDSLYALLRKEKASA